MANIDIEVAGRRYNVACRDGEEEHLRSVAAEVDRRAQDAHTALGSLTETRQLLFAALLIADDIKEIRAGAGIPDPLPPIVKLGRKTAGSPISRSQSRASATLCTVRPRATSSPILFIAC